MSQFGNRLPGLIQQPAAPVDTSKIGPDFGRGLAEALGVIGTLQQARVVDAKDKLQDQEYAQRLQVGAEDIKQARIRSDIAQTQYKSLDAQLQTDDEKHKAALIVQNETFGFRSVLAQLGPEGAAKWLTEHPIHDPENAQQASGMLGNQLAILDQTAAEQEIAADPEHANVPGMLARYLSKRNLDGLDPQAIISYRGTLLSNMLGYQRGQINSLAKKRQDKAAGLSSEQADQAIRSDLYNHALTSGMDIVVPSVGIAANAQMFDSVRASNKFNGEDASDTAVGYETADRIAKIASDWSAKFGYDPGRMQQLRSWLDSAVAGDDHMHRVARERVKSLGVFDAADEKITGVQQAMQDQQRQDMRQQISDASAAGDIPVLLTLREPAAKLGLADHWQAKYGGVETGRAEFTALSDYMIAGSAEKPPTHGRDTLDKAMDQFGLSAVLERVGDVPDKAIREMETDLKVGRIPEAYAIFDKINAIMPDVAARIAGGIPHGQMLRVMSKGLDGVDPQSPYFAQVMNVFAGPNAEMAWTAAEQNIAESSGKGSEKAVAANPLNAARAKMYDKFTAPNTANPIAPELFAAFNDRYRFYYMQRFSPDGDPNGTSAYAAGQATDAVIRDSTVVRNMIVPANLFGVGNLASDYHAQDRGRLESELNSFAKSHSGAIVSPEKSIRANGHTYVPAIGVDESGAVPQSKAEAFLEWNPATHEAKQITSGPLYDTLYNTIAGRVKPEDLNPQLDVRWHPDYPTKSLQQFDTMTGGGMSQRIMQRIVDQWTWVYGPMPQPDEPGFAQHMQTLRDAADALAHRSGWMIDGGQQQ